MDDYRALSAALQNEDWERLIELQKQSVRAMCSNDYRWFELGEAYLKAGQPDHVIEVLQEVHERGAEIKPETFEFQPGLAAFVQSDPFLATALGRELTALGEVAATRRRDFRVRLDSLDPGDRPPESYVAKDACPFECCSFRQWGVLEATDLYDGPAGSVIVGSVGAGSTVRAVTGEVHLRPLPIAVVHDHPPFSAGQIVFQLDYLGEGFANYWLNGEIHSNDLWADEICIRPGKNCRAEYLDPPGRRHQPVWWILIETPQGLRGWTDRSEHFDNRDACG